MKKNHIILIFSIIGFFLLIFVYSLIDVKNVILNLRNANVKYLLIYALVIIIMDILYTLRWNLVLKSYGYNINFLRLALYNLCGFGVGFLTSQTYVGGEPVRAILLTREKIDFKKGISTCIIDRAMQVTTDLFFVVIAVVLLFIHFSFSPRFEILVMSGIIVPIALLLFFYTRMKNKKSFFSIVFDINQLKKKKHLHKLRTNLQEIDKTIQEFFMQHRNALLQIFIINFIVMLLVLSEYWLVLNIFGIQATLFSVLLVILATSVSYTLPIPLALGSLEVAQVTALKFLKISRLMAITISALIRIKDLIRALIGVAFLAYFGVSWKSLSKR
jgi:uncharacterized protein (TIRG00374 family)